MLSIIRTFCVVSCLISGVYACIIFYYFRNTRRMVWFAALCFALAVNVNLSISFYPGKIFNVEYVAGISDNVYFASQSLVTLCLAIYTGFFLKKKPDNHHTFLTYACCLFAAVSAIIPPSFSVHAYFLLCVISIYGLIYCINISLKSIKEVSKAYVYPTAAYFLMLIASVIDYVAVIFFRESLSLVSFRVLFTPEFILLHGGMMTAQYISSLNKTKKLSESLIETIEKINHSDNALMCTQMNADFLYKSLDLISKRCDEDPFSAEDITVSLSKYLRHTLNFQQLQGIVPLSNELELTKAFIAIERERNRKLTFEYKFPNPLPDFHIPPLSIQPIVENAIEHAFTPDMENPKVTITIIPYRDYFHIDISDNGIGMSEETMMSLTDSLHGNARIGIYNIHTRLINLFGKGLAIQSAPGVGTSVSFVVPPDAISYIKEKDNKEEKA